MGPIVLLDKSTIQSLSPPEVDLLFRYYTVNIAPVLVAEILGDLMKPDRAGVISTKQAAILARKLPQTSSSINPHYSVLMLDSLMGQEIPMDGRPAMYIGQRGRNSDGQLVCQMYESPEERAIHRWRNGEFTDEEGVISARWRESAKSIDLGQTKAAYADIASWFPARPKSFADLMFLIDGMLSDPEFQPELLTIIMEEFTPPAEFASSILHRWKSGNFRTVKEFAPYAFHCYRLTFAFNLGITLELLSTRATNELDLEYAYYLPFTAIFASSDNFHREFIPHILRPDQVFVWGVDLKDNLKAILADCQSREAAEQKKWHKENWDRPPDNPQSFTYRMWDKFCSPRTPPGSPLSEEEQAALLRRLKSFIPEGSVPEMGVYNEFEYEVISRVRYLSPDDPCPKCKDGTKLKDCHFDEFMEAQRRSNG